MKINIETEFNPGDKVRAMSLNKPVEFEIEKVEISHYGYSNNTTPSTTITYHRKKDAKGTELIHILWSNAKYSFKEGEVYSSKELLLQSL